MLLNKIKELLVAGINGEELIAEISSHFYESIEDARKEHPHLYERLDDYETLQDYFDMDTDGLDYDETLMVDDLVDDIEYLLQFRFDVVEDSVKKDLIEGSMSAEVKKEMRAQNVVPMSGKLTEDEVEEFYLEAFRQFDMLRARIYRMITENSPRGFYDQGRESIEEFKKSHHLLMDERDFLTAFQENLDKDNLKALLARRVYEVFHLHRRYRLEVIDLSDEVPDPDEEEPETDEQSEWELPPDESEGVLEPIGDLDPAEFTFIYELMNEYTGHRVLPSDDDRVSEAYWSTYADDFSELLGMYMIDALEKTIRHLVNDLPIQYDSLAKYYHWNQEQRRDPEVILSTSDKISYALSDLQEKLWADFNESYLMPYFEQGKAIAEASK
ncbi:MAG: hypothetical protein II642_05610 [Firmicutes bacterium]|nr:hypothetical protein [Bacillota bacterium]